MAEKAKYAVSTDKSRQFYLCTKHKEAKMKEADEQKVDKAFTVISGDTWCETCIEEERKQKEKKDEI